MLIRDSWFLLDHVHVGVLINQCFCLKCPCDILYIIIIYYPVGFQNKCRCSIYTILSIRLNNFIIMKQYRLMFLYTYLIKIWTVYKRRQHLFHVPYFRTGFNYIAWRYHISWTSCPTTVTTATFVVVVVPSFWLFPSLYTRLAACFPCGTVPVPCPAVKMARKKENTKLAPEILQHRHLFFFLKKRNDSCTSF